MASSMASWTGPEALIHKLAWIVVLLAVVEGGWRV